MLRSLLLVVGVTAAFASVVHAEPANQKFPPGTMLGGTRAVVITPPEQWSSGALTQTSNVIYANRCSGGCMVTVGTINDASTSNTTIGAAGQRVIGEYQNDAKQSGAAADAEWNAIMQCLKDVWSPYNVVVSDVKPTGVRYTEAMIGGISAELGATTSQGELLGVAPGDGGCNARDNAINFTFANSGYYFAGDSQQRIWEVCATAVQETAHVFGMLDHAYQFTDGTSACNDPMTYRTDCGGEKFFRNKPALSGDFKLKDRVICGEAVNSHVVMLNTFGPAESIIPPPTVSIDSPTSGTVANGAAVTFKAGSKRGVAKSELYVNGWLWAEVKGAAFGLKGQPNPSNYSILLPANLPDGVLDIKIKAYDDLAIATESQTTTVTKGAPCTSASTCATGQKCDAGKCFWETPTGVLGDSCDYEQFCTSNMCVMTDEGGYCSQNCIVGGTDACPMGFDCVAAGTGGACLPIPEAGCCSASTSGQIWVQGAMSVLVLGFVVRRRRRR